MWIVEKLPKSYFISVYGQVNVLLEKAYIFWPNQFLEHLILKWMLRNTPPHLSPPPLPNFNLLYGHIEVLIARHILRAGYQAWASCLLIKVFVSALSGILSTSELVYISIYSQTFTPISGYLSLNWADSLMIKIHVCLLF